jgi:aspartyl/glutamyl-tRNA(Asn/Gln) amidotransferase C subunit
MTTSHKLSKPQVLHIAELINVKISPEELILFSSQLEETVSYVSNLDELDTKTTEATAHSTNASNVFFKDATVNDRQFTSKEALSQAKKKVGDFFVVDRVLE